MAEVEKPPDEDGTSPLHSSPWSLLEILPSAGFNGGAFAASIALLVVVAVMPVVNF